MKANFIPKEDREVQITLKESEAEEILYFIGGTNPYDRKKVCKYLYNDGVVSELFIELNKIIPGNGREK